MSRRTRSSHDHQFMRQNLCVRLLLRPRWIDWALIYSLYLCYGACLRLSTLPTILNKWANAWHQTWWIALAGLFLGALEDICVCTCTCLLVLWPFDRQFAARPTRTTTGRGDHRESDVAKNIFQDGYTPQRRDWSGSSSSSAAASSPDSNFCASSPLSSHGRQTNGGCVIWRYLRLVVYALVFLTSQVCCIADCVFLRTRQLRFTMAFVGMYLHERDAIAQFEVTDEEWRILAVVIVPTIILAAFVGWLGAVWINLAEWDILEAAHVYCMNPCQPPSNIQSKKRYGRLQKDEEIPDLEDNTHANDPMSVQAATKPTKCCSPRRFSPYVLLVALITALLTSTLLLSKLVPSIVAVIALNTSLNEPFRLVFGTQFTSTRQVTVKKRISDFVEHATENATMFHADSLYRRTIGFHGPLAFDVDIKPNEQPNVLVIVVEAFRQRDSEYLLQEEDGQIQEQEAKRLLPANMTLTPNFDKWAKRGIAFRNMWSTWRTSRSLETILFGQLPYDSVTSTGTTGGRAEVELAGLPQLFAAKGYDCLFTTGTRIDYDDWDRFLPTHGFNRVLGMWDLVDIIETEMDFDWMEGAHFMTYWGMHDDLSFSVLAHLLKKAEKQKQDPDKRPFVKPWFVTHYTISSHTPFDERPDWYYKYQRHIPDFSAFYAGKKHEKLLKDYAEMRYFSDLVFGSIMQELETSGILNDTIVVVIGDHGQAPEQGSATPEQDQISSSRVAAAIIAEGRLSDADKGKILDDAASQSDLLNTIADIVGVPAEGFLQSGIGRSLKRAIPFGERIVYDSNPAMNLAAIQGHTRMQFYADTSDAIQVYHTEFDPLQEHDLMAELAQSRIDEITEICDEGRLLNDYFKHRWDNACILAPTC